MLCLLSDGGTGLNWVPVLGDNTTIVLASLKVSREHMEMVYLCNYGLLAADELLLGRAMLLLPLDSTPV